MSWRLFRQSRDRATQGEERQAANRPVPTCLPGESSVAQPASVKLASDFSPLASGLPAEAPDTSEQSQVNPIMPRAPSPQSHEKVNESCHFKTLSFEVICSAAKITDTMGTDVHSALRVHREQVLSLIWRVWQVLCILCVCVCVAKDFCMIGNWQLNLLLRHIHASSPRLGDSRA